MGHLGFGNGSQSIETTNSIFVAAMAWKTSTTLCLKLSFWVLFLIGWLIILFSFNLPTAHPVPPTLLFLNLDRLSIHPQNNHQLCLRPCEMIIYFPLKLLCCHLLLRDNEAEIDQWYWSGQLRPNYNGYKDGRLQDALFPNLTIEWGSMASPPQSWRTTHDLKATVCPGKM